MLKNVILCNSLVLSKFNFAMTLYSVFVNGKNIRKTKIDKMI